MDARDHVVPGARVVLTEETAGWIPGAVVATEQPAPVGEISQQDPHRLSQCAGKMRDAGIDRDDKIQLRYQRRGVGKIIERVAAIKNIGAPFEKGGVLGANVLLQTHERAFGAQGAQKRQEFAQVDGPFAVSLVAGVTRPDQADPGTPLSLQARLPRRHALRWRGQISSGRRNCFEPRSECEWKTDQRAMKVESWKGTTLRHNLRPAAKRQHQRL